MRIFVSLLLICSLAFGGNHFSPKGPTGVWDTTTAAGILNGNGVWDINNSLFNYDTLGVKISPFCQGCNVAFGATGSTAGGGAVTVNGIQKINSFSFNFVPSGNYLITGGEISCVNFASCTYTANASGTIASLISGSKDLIKQGAQTLTLSGVNTYTGNTNVNAGTLEATTNVEAIPGNLIIAAGATGHLNVTGTKTFPNTISGSGTLKVTAGGTVGTVTTLSGDLSGLIGLFDIFPSAGGGGKINLTNATQANTPPLGSTIKLNNGATIFLNQTLNYGSNFSLYGGTTGETLGQLRVENGTVTGPVTLFANSSIGTNGPTGFISGEISGGFGFTKEGSGNITLTNNNTYTGTTIISAGTLQLGDGAKTNNIIPATNLITDNAALVYNTPSTITHSGLISGTGTLTKEGAGTLTISPSSTYTGATTVNTGTLKLSMTNLDQNASSGFAIASGAFLVLDPTTAGNARIANSNPIITGAGTVQKISANSMIMANSAASKQTQFNLSAGGLVDVQAGLLTSISTLATNLADININTGTTVTINDDGTSNSIAYFNGLTGAGLIRTHGATAARTLSVGNNNATTIFSGVIADGTAPGILAFTKNGTGIQTLSGANTYTGTTNVNVGTLILSNTSTSPTFNIASGAVLELNASGADREGGSAQTFNGLGTLRKTGANSIYWSPVATFALGSGALIDVQGGTFVGGNSANDIWTSNLSDLNVVAGATFNGVEANVRVDSLSGTGSILSGHIAGYLNFTFGVDNGGGTFDGVLGNTVGWTGNFVKAGNGTQILTGVNTYTGSTTVSAGTLQISGAGSLNSGSYAGAISNSGTFKYSSSAAQTFSGGITGTGSLIKDTSTSILTLTGAGTFSGTTTVSNGTLKLRGASVTVLAGSIINNSTLEIGNTLAGWGNKKDIAAAAISGAGDVIFNSGANTNTGNANAQLDGGTVNLTGNYTDTGPISITGNLAIESGGVNTSADVTISNVSVLCNRNRNPIFGGLNGLGFVALCAGGSGTLTIGNGNKDGDFSGQIKANQNGIDGTLGGGLINITKIGTGRQKISVSSCFTGTTTVTGGILELVNADICGTINDNATLNYNNSSDITHSGAISGTGSIIKDGTGVLSITGNNTSFTGSVTVNAGTFLVNYPSAVGSAITVKSGTTLTLGDNGAGLNAWSAPLTFSGPDSGTNAWLELTSLASLADHTWSGTIALNTPTTFNTAHNVRPNNFTGVISGASPLTVASSGGAEITFSGNNNYSGGTTVSTGSFRTTVNSGAGTGTITLGDANTGTRATSWFFQGGGTPANNVVVSNQGTGTVTIGTNSGGTFTTPSGTMTLNRATSFSDGTGDRTTFTGRISGNVGTITISQGRVTFNNASNNFVGNLSIADGAVYQNDSPTALPITTDVNMNGNGNFRINTGGTHTIDGLNGQGTDTVSIITASVATLSLGNGNGGGTFNGVIANGGAVLTLIKTGTGGQTLTGANTYTGATTVTGGVLWFTNAGTSIGSTSGFTISGGGNLTFANGADVTYTKAITWSGTGGELYLTQPDFGRTFTYTGNWTLNGPASLDSNKGGAGRINIDGIISGGSSLTYIGSTWTWVRGNNTYTGGTTLNNGSYVTCGHLRAFGTGTVTVNAGATLNKAGCGMTNTVINNGTVNP